MDGELDGRTPDAGRSGRRGAAAADAAPGRDRRDRPGREVVPRLGPRSALQHGREPARLVHLAPARVGRADSGGRLHEVRRSAPDAGAGRPRRGGVRQLRRRRVVRAADRRVPARRADLPGVRRHGVRARARHPRRLVRLRARATRRCCPSAPSSPGRPTCTSRAAISTAAGSRARCWSASARAAGRRSARSSPTASSSTEDGRKMSKSLGNAIEPQDIIKESGAEILRLWVAMVDYREEMRVGKQILARVVEAYRKIRNTCRYLLANLYDFDPAVDRVPLDADARRRSVCARRATPTAAATVLDAYDEPTTSRRSSSASTSSRRSTCRPSTPTSRRTGSTRSRPTRPNAARRRPRCTSIADGLTRLLAPILPVTPTSSGATCPGSREASVHLAEFPRDAEVDASIDGDSSSAGSG